LYYNVLLEVFTQRNFVTDFIRLLKKNLEKSLFEPPIGDLGVMYALHV